MVSGWEGKGWSTAYETGRRDHRSGKEREQCPFQQDYQVRDWLRGWDDAEQEEKSLPAQQAEQREQAHKRLKSIRMKYRKAQPRNIKGTVWVQCSRCGRKFIVSGGTGTRTVCPDCSSSDYIKIGKVNKQLGKSLNVGDKGLPQTVGMASIFLTVSPFAGKTTADNSSIRVTSKCNPCGVPIS